MSSTVLPADDQAPLHAPPAVAGQIEWVTRAFEAAQVDRIATGEQLRAILQGRSTAWGPVAPMTATEIDDLLTAIRRGETDGPVPLPARHYRRRWDEERQLLRELPPLVEAHPAWSWMGRIRGIGHVLAARLLVRLRLERAPTPSSFWAYAGLVPEPRVPARCGTCGLVIDVPLTRRAPATHRVPGTTVPCTGALLLGERPDAPSDRSHRVGRPFNRELKGICYLVGLSFVRRGGSYRTFYLEQKARLVTTRPTWPPARHHRAAMRATEKLFLANLWSAWRAAVGLSDVPPYVARFGGAPPLRTPWCMVDR